MCASDKKGLRIDKREQDLNAEPLAWIFNEQWTFADGKVLKWIKNEDLFRSGVFSLNKLNR